MKAVKIEVMTVHYMGPLVVEQVAEDNSLFSVYMEGSLLGRVQPVQKINNILWYSKQITDKDLLGQIGEWIEHHFPLTQLSFQRMYEYRF